MKADGKPHQLTVTDNNEIELKDIHPRNKLDVGNRLALWALAKNYDKKDVVYSGPLYKSMKVDGDSIQVNFAHATGLKSRDDKPLSEFQFTKANTGYLRQLAALAQSQTLPSARRRTPRRGQLRRPARFVPTFPRSPSDPDRPHGFP